MSLNILRQQIADVVEGVTVGDGQGQGLATGIPTLDTLLPSSGIPRGRLTEILGARGVGRTTLLRRIVQSVVSSGLWIAYIDADRTLAPRDWASLGNRYGHGGNNDAEWRAAIEDVTESAARNTVQQSARNTVQINTMGNPGRLWVVRPPNGDAQRGAWCADILLRSGAFALVVLDGAPLLARSIAVRLSRLARDTNSAFVVTAEDRNATMMGGALRLRVQALTTNKSTNRHRSRARRRIFYKTMKFAVTVEKGGNPANMEVCCAIGVENRLCAHPTVPDRRGVARRSRGKWGSGTTQGADAPLSVAANDQRTKTIQTNTVTAAPSPSTLGGSAAVVDKKRRTLARKRRFAEPEIRAGTLTSALG